MDNAGILIPLLGIMCGIIAIISSAYLKAQKMKLEMAQANRISSASEAEMMSELQRLKDRVAVLERLATDGDRKLAGEIDRLRDDRRV
jgi:precorrin-6B methylase 1